ncbi:MAG: DNA polymerase III subunit beta [Limnochordia bacterium]|jgi:DNA polymerase-3 subunit beta|nr:DNA polymerase III subunit beta [Bacillota bacterium]
MKVICRQDDLMRGVSIVERAVSTRDIRPALMGIQLEAMPGELRLAGCDLEMRIEYVIPAETSREGKALVEGRYFSAIARRLPDGMVELEQDDHAGVLHVRGGRADMTLHLIVGEEFPEPPAGDYLTGLTLDQELLKTMIKQTAFATADADELRAFMRGILFEVQDGQLHLVATDSSRLAVRRASAPDLPPLRVLVPARALQELARFLPFEGAEAVEIAVGDNQIAMKVGGAAFYSRLFEATFPDYRMLLPKDMPTKVVVGRKALEEAIDRVSLVVRKGPAVVDFALKSGVMELLCQSKDVGRGFDELAASQEGPDIEISFQARLITEALKALDDHDEVSMAFTSETGPMVLSIPGEDDYLYLLMPVRG